MKHQTIKLTVLAVIVILQCLLTLKIIAMGSDEKTQAIETEHAQIIFYDQESVSFSKANQTRIAEITEQTILAMNKVMPGLADKITVNVKLMDRDLAIVHGVTGRADHRDEIEVSISTQFEGGIDAAIEAGLEGVLFHEFHHTIRGWVINDNAFGPGIDIATVNEGLADVFAESQVGHRLNTMSTDEDFDAWINEILALPSNANYGQWMFMHPDGRIAVGYRAGEHLVKKALTNSDMSIIELSELTVAQVYQLAGYNYTK